MTSTLKQLSSTRRRVAAGETDLTDEQVRHARSLWRAAGYELPAWTPAPPAVQQRRAGNRAAARVPGVGDMMAEVIGESWFATLIGKIRRGCKGGCGALQRDLNEWGPAKCEAKRGEIIAHIHENAGLPDTVLTHGTVDGWLTEAIRRHTAAADAARAKVRTPTVAKLKNTPTVPSESIPFTAEPRLTLLFHVWPHGDAWRKHIPRLQPNLHRFHRRILGIAHDNSTATIEETRAAFGDGWHVVTAKNKLVKSGRGGLREVATYQQMLPMLAGGDNDVTFCLHGKGMQPHNQKAAAIAWWTDALYRTVYENIDGVIAAMQNGAAIVGSFRRIDGQNNRAMLGTRNRWHFSGAFYAFRNAIAFSNGIPSHRQQWFGTESWPGDYFPVEASHCIFGDRAGDLYKPEQQPRESFEQWKAEHAT